MHIYDFFTNLALVFAFFFLIVTITDNSFCMRFIAQLDDGHLLMTKTSHYFVNLK